MARRRGSSGTSGRSSLPNELDSLLRPNVEPRIAPWSPGEAAEVSFGDFDLGPRSGPVEVFRAPRRATRGVITPNRQPFDLLRRLYVRAPKRDLLCVARKVRREVMHALRVAGRSGVGAGKRRHTTRWSEWRC